MVIIRACHYEIDDLRHNEFFVNQEVAERHTKDWKVTDWGKIYYHPIQVTEE